MSRTALLPLALLAALSGGCSTTADGDPSIEESAHELSAGRTLRLQAGTRLIVYGVTDDDFVVFQDGPAVYAAALRPGAPRRFVADVGDTRPTVFISGRVAFVWTAQLYFGAGGVSPLVVWTAEDGPRLAASSSVVSLVGTQGVAVRPDSDEIVFIANVNPEGTVGDIVSARPDLGGLRTLAAGVDVNFNGPCRPLVGYDARDGIRRFAAHPVISYCPAGATSGILARFVDGRRRELATGLALPPIWSSDPRGARFFTILGAERTPVLVSAQGDATVLAGERTGTGFIDDDGAVLTRADLPGGRELHRFRDGSPGAEVLADLGNVGFFVGHRDEGFRHYTDRATSRDGRLLTFADSLDPATGLTNRFLIDVSRRPEGPVVLETGLVTAQSFELFTRDSRHALYYKFDLATFNPTLHAATLDGENRAISSGAATEFAHFALGGGLVAYSDRLDGTGVDLLDLHDIVLADVGAARLAPRTLAARAYNLFFPTPDRRAIVFTSDQEPGGSGLFITRAR